ncbi:MAG TPA: hypothetical protein VI542_12380 [Candidatus Tectomicrobia bacterium]
MAEHKPKEAPPVRVVPQTVARVYLANPDINRFSMWHTAYVGEKGDSTKLHRLEILGGVKRNVPLSEYERFRAAGVITTERPRANGNDDEE